MPLGTARRTDGRLTLDSRCASDTGANDAVHWLVFVWYRRLVAPQPENTDLASSYFVHSQ